MEAREFINFLGIIEKLKCNTRHSVTSSGREESVAEHSWRISVMAMLAAPEFPEIDMEKVMRMCLVHDFGEAITGDIPAFIKTEEHRQTEDTAVENLLKNLPEPQRGEISALFSEMEEMSTGEAKLWKALDKCEALLQHNEADISSWLPLEYDLQLTYGQEECMAFPFARALRAELEKDSKIKIKKNAVPL